MHSTWLTAETILAALRSTSRLANSILEKEEMAYRKSDAHFLIEKLLTPID